MLPAAYEWLNSSVHACGDHPRMVFEALKEFGTHEGVGAADNAKILAWAREIGLAPEYRHDSEAWCGLFMGVCAHRAGKAFPKHPLWALNWAGFGEASPAAALGDVLAFRRFDEHGKFVGGHVGLYVGEDRDAFHVLGGNQGDEVKIVRVPRRRLAAVRRPLYVVLPENVTPIKLAIDGVFSKNEA